MRSMKKFINIFLLINLFSIFENSFLSEFDTQDPAILISNDLPYLKNGTLDNKLLSYVGNGHLASTVFDTSIYVNGLYNGKEGESHRARIPNIHNFFLNSPDGNFKDKQYVLHLKNGENFQVLEKLTFFLE